MPWTKEAPGFGFGPSANTWLPQPPVYADYAVDQQRGVPGSTLELYRTLLSKRAQLGLGRASLALVEGYAADVVALEAVGPHGARVRIVSNLGEEPVELPQDADVIVASGPLEDGAVPTDTTVWVRCS
jgi:alpha-glucosidase